MKYILIYFFLFPVGLLLCDASAAEKARTFRNEDLQKFQVPTVPDNSSKQGPSPKEDSSSIDLSEKQAKERWCSAGTVLRERVDKARQLVEEAEKRRRDADMEWNWNLDYKAKLIIAAEEDLRQARKELAIAQKELDDLEQSAYRQGIPPGWLRCQFDY
jgi:hypothetical protein